MFENGEHQSFDVKPYLTHGIFVRLQNKAMFQDVRIVAGSVEWPGELDLSYDTLYIESQPIVSRAQLLAVLTKAPDVEPEEADKLPE